MANLSGRQSPNTGSNDESLMSSGPSGSLLGSQQSPDITLIPSVWAMAPSIQAQAFKQEYGRDYSEVYELPAAEEEKSRLRRQHEMFNEVLGKYPPCLPEIMQPDADDSTEPKACLDLGCGSGMWIMEIAREFPDALAVAVDLVPMQCLTMPDNCRSEVDDINLGLEHFYGNFNVVHVRLIAAGIHDYVNFIDEVSHVLRPDGLLDMVEFDFHVYDHMEDGNHRRCEVDGNTIAEPWLARWLMFADVAAQNAGGQTDAATHVQRWITAHPAFQHAVYQDYWIPVSPHPSFNEFQRRIGSQMRDDLMSFLKSGRPLLLGSGVPEAIVDELQQNAERELHTAARAQYIRCQSIYCRKKAP
ncbi:S-adenosyl-L-methionine-dependent methyltransferase [Mycena metata]|uniref:S-adenosyl-L-methionine-dependent methyltransferase n=1 Tax=Mycena metata TaxID=1033252 RepID=A0AAD7NKR9_9AGAR|nr:S-adenosyl-L-methionine-dependent methyltransferase [Mycena metata]